MIFTNLLPTASSKSLDISGYKLRLIELNKKKGSNTSLVVLNTLSLQHTMVSATYGVTIITASLVFLKKTKKYRNPK